MLARKYSHPMKTVDPRPHSLHGISLKLRGPIQTISTTLSTSQTSISHHSSTSVNPWTLTYSYINPYYTLIIYCSCHHRDTHPTLLKENSTMIQYWVMGVHPQSNVNYNFNVFNAFSINYNLLLTMEPRGRKIAERMNVNCSS